MSAWIDFVKKVAKRDKISYTEALKKASGEYKKTKTTATKGAKSKSDKGELDYTTKKGMVRVVDGKRQKGRKGFDKK